MDSGDIIRLKTPVTDRDHAIGSADAPVTLLEYGNFECIDCGLAYPILKQLRKALPEDLRFVFRTFPSTRAFPHALRAAEAAESASSQGRFWEMHDQLFQHQNALEDSDLKRYAGLAGLDVKRFESDMEQHTFLKQIEEDYQSSLFVEHVTGTPTIYINGLMYTGAVGLESLLEAIKEADTEGRITTLTEHHRLKELIRRLRSR